MGRTERYKGKAGGEQLFRAIMEIIIPSNHQYSRVVEDCRLADATATKVALARMYKKMPSKVGSAKEAKKVLKEDIRRKLKTRDYLLASRGDDVEEMVEGVKASFDPDDMSVEPGGSGWLFTMTGLDGPYRDYILEKHGDPSVKGQTPPEGAQEASEAVMGVLAEDYDPSKELVVREHAPRSKWAFTLREGSAGFYVATVLEKGCSLEFKGLMREVHKLDPKVKEGTVRVAIHFLRKKGVPIVKVGREFRMQ